MRIKLALPILFAAIAVCALGSSAAQPRIELRADSARTEGSKMVGQGMAVAVVGDTTVSGEHIVIDSEAAEIVCRGEAVIKTAPLTITAKDPRISTKRAKSPGTPLNPREIPAPKTQHGVRANTHVGHASSMTFGNVDAPRIPSC